MRGSIDRVGEAIDLVFRQWDGRELDHGGGLAAAQDLNFPLHPGHAFFLKSNLIVVVRVIRDRNADNLQNFRISLNRSLEDGLESFRSNFLDALELRENWAEVGWRKFGWLLHGSSEFASEGALLQGSEKVVCLI